MRPDTTRTVTAIYRYPDFLDQGAENFMPSVVAYLPLAWQFGQSVQFIRRVEGRAAVDSSAGSMRPPRVAA
jgi:hypothetical protein